MASGIDIKQSDKSTKKELELLDSIKKIIKKHGIDDSEWTKAISGQFFLVSLTRLLKLNKKKNYENLMNACLASFKPTFSGTLKLDESSLQITPEETKKIIELMKEEDKNDNYFTIYKKTSANNIDSRLMYFNYHYALLLSIASEENNNVFLELKQQCLEHLFSDDSIDDSDGWYPYRVPWITARILTNLKDTDYSDFSDRNIDSVIDDAIESLFQRIDDNKPIWRSGFGTWVSVWESTGLCLEALYKWDKIGVNEQKVKKVIDYVLSNDVIEQWLIETNTFDTEEQSNEILGGVVLASSVYQITEKYFTDLFQEHQERILRYFKSIIDIIHKGKVKQIGQFTTIPQILYYVALSVLKEE